jgi:hypothetical protein
VYNVGAAFLVAFPSSTLGQLAGLPPSAPVVYRALLAMFVFLFAGAYAWLARQAIISRPLVAMSAIGKASAFMVVLACWLAGAAPARGVLGALGDLIFAGIFFAWLRRPAEVARLHA